MTKYPLVTLPPVETVDEQGREIAEGWQSALGRTYQDFKVVWALINRISLINPEKGFEIRRELSNLQGGGGESCQAHPFKQSIKHPGCLTKVVVNRSVFLLLFSEFLRLFHWKKSEKSKF